MKDNSYSILLCTCDQNEGIVKENVALLERFWPSRGKVYLMSEKKDFAIQGTETIKTGCVPWSERIYKALNFVPCDYVMVILDDFWVEKPVDGPAINQVVESMKINPDVVNVAFSHMPNATIDYFVGHFVRVKRSGLSMVNWQAGIWKKTALLALLRKNENPWESEIFGTERAKKYRHNSFCCVDDNANSPFVYNNGWLIVRGKWNLAEVSRLTQKLDIVIDTTGRGTISKSVIPMSFTQKAITKFRIWAYRLKCLTFRPKEIL